MRIIDWSSDVCSSDLHVQRNDQFFGWQVSGIGDVHLRSVARPRTAGLRIVFLGVLIGFAPCRIVAQSVAKFLCASFRQLATPRLWSDDLFPPRMRTGVGNTRRMPPNAYAAVRKQDTRSA